MNALAKKAEKKNIILHNELGNANILVFHNILALGRKEEPEPGGNAGGLRPSNWEIRRKRRLESSILKACLQMLHSIWKKGCFIQSNTDTRRVQLVTSDTEPLGYLTTNLPTKNSLRWGCVVSMTKLTYKCSTLSNWKRWDVTDSCLKQKLHSWVSPLHIAITTNLN